MAKKPKKPEPPENHERWLVSYADYMTLLFALFVVLYSFAMAKQSEYNAMVKAFMDSLGTVGLISRPAGTPALEGGTGILEKQTDIKAAAGEKDPADALPPEPLPIEALAIDLNVGNATKNTEGKDPTLTDATSYLTKAEDQTELVGKLRDKLDKHRLEIEQLGQQVVIRINDGALFPEGSAFLQPRLRPMVQDISAILQDIPGVITVTGHTDDTPELSDGLFKSNWELSSLRSVAVVEVMLENKKLAENRVIAQGRAHTLPLAKNDTAANRAKNRRIEISITQGQADEGGVIDIKNSKAVVKKPENGG